MSGFLKAVLIAILTMVSIVILFNAAFFFPWYLTIVEKGFTVSQVIATNNYLPYNEYKDILKSLQDLPIFRERNDAEELKIEATHLGGDIVGKNAIEIDYHDLEHYYGLGNETDPREADKPYVQMGNPVLITIFARYPFQMTLFGNALPLADIPISFSMTTTTTKHYKDLEYEYIIDHSDPSLEIDDNFFDWEPE
ncbi:MAG: hypothetical protein FWG61_04165 [Firmicutes bacterium]|nr:hypothetical protein [Bacillota bacterium]